MCTHSAVNALDINYNVFVCLDSIHVRDDSFGYDYEAAVAVTGE